MNRLTNGADRLREVFDRMPQRHVTCFEMNFRRAVIIAGDEAMQDFGEEQPFLHAKPPHDSEVDRDQPSFVIDEQVPGMHVGMKEAVTKRMTEEALNESLGEQRQIEAFDLQPRPIRQW